MPRVKRRRPKSPKKVRPQQRLIALANSAIDIAKTARKHRQSLSGLNFYANKMADIRADATNEFTRLSTRSVGDTSALAELMQRVFSIDASAKERAQATREIQFALKTAWPDTSEDVSQLEDAGVFPLAPLSQTKRGYLISVGRQMNGCYASGWYDGCAVMMRRLLESSIIEAFEARQIDVKIKDGKTGDFLQLTGLVRAALAENSWNLPRNVRSNLEDLRDLGHRSAHNRYYLARKADIDKHVGVYREAVEAFLHLAKLL